MGVWCRSYRAVLLVGLMTGAKVKPNIRIVMGCGLGLKTEAVGGLPAKATVMIKEAKAKGGQIEALVSPGNADSESDLAVPTLDQDEKGIYTTEMVQVKIPQEDQARLRAYRVDNFALLCMYALDRPGEVLIRPTPCPPPCLHQVFSFTTIITSFFARTIEMLVAVKDSMTLIVCRLGDS
jgi:hypothetical protein